MSEDEMKAAIHAVCRAWASLKIAQRDDDAYNLKSSKAWDLLDQAIVEAERKCRQELPGG